MTISRYCGILALLPSFLPSAAAAFIADQAPMVFMGATNVKSCAHVGVSSSTRSKLSTPRIKMASTEENASDSAQLRLYLEEYQTNKSIEDIFNEIDPATIKGSLHQHPPYAPHYVGERKEEEVSSDSTQSYTADHEGMEDTKTIEERFNEIDPATLDGFPNKIAHETPYVDGAKEEQNSSTSIQFPEHLLVEYEDHSAFGDNNIIQIDPAEEEAIPSQTTHLASNIGNLKSPQRTKLIPPVTVQGGTLKTCSFPENIERISLYLKTDGRPLNADVEMWQGPENSPQKISLYIEDGFFRTFSTTLELPGDFNSIAVRNTGELELPITAGLEAESNVKSVFESGGDIVGPAETLISTTRNIAVIQGGGTVYTANVPPSVQSMECVLSSDGRPLNAKIEFIQGPDNAKQVMDVYTENGHERPFYIVFDTPGNDNVIRIVNTGTVQFPLFAAVEPYEVDDMMTDLHRNNSGSIVWS